MVGRADLARAYQPECIFANEQLQIPSSKPLTECLDRYGSCEGGNCTQVACVDIDTLRREQKGKHTTDT